VLAPPPRFFGLERSAFDALLTVARTGVGPDTTIEPAVVPEDTGSLSLLRDGTALGPADYFEPAEIMES
jgi:hypothetical protein